MSTPMSSIQGLTMLQLAAHGGQLPGEAETIDLLFRLLPLPERAPVPPNPTAADALLGVAPAREPPRTSVATFEAAALPDDLRKEHRKLLLQQKRELMAQLYRDYPEHIHELQLRECDRPPRINPSDSPHLVVAAPDPPTAFGDVRATVMASLAELAAKASGNSPRSYTTGTQLQRLQRLQQDLGQSFL
uniref:Uncharacterized protein n=1 Tax=Eutreptiella gymnastica TaxID=73025 RepID=A0A7S1HTH7_9EUGL|mmetsp:Transcript_104234/g.179646  ORF Transcript_104234/g.179646 Transcript_104234/m.179646 type:complete len:189 (+) Transcript_104234:107-673(+)